MTFYWGELPSKTLFSNSFKVALLSYVQAKCPKQVSALMGPARTHQPHPDSLKYPGCSQDQTELLKKEHIQLCHCSIFSKPLLSLIPTVYSDLHGMLPSSAKPTSMKIALLLRTCLSYDILRRVFSVEVFSQCLERYSRIIKITVTSNYRQCL